MKKKFVYITLIIYLFSFCQLDVIAVNNAQITEITKIENDLFGFEYLKDDITSRVARLEKNIYGKEFSGDLSNRIKKIAKDITAEQIGLEIEPTEDSFIEKEQVADNTVNYPILDEIEMKVFKKTYKERDFHTRIVTIEKELFGKIYDVEDYSKRMDRIKAEVLPERLAREKVFGYDNSEDISSIDLSGLNSNRFSSKMPYGQENYTRPYSNYGNYAETSPMMDENMNSELSQLEYNTFGTEFSNEDTKTRIKRLNSANKAKKSSNRYDSMRFQQRMSTAMEIGAMLLMILAMVL